MVRPLAQSRPIIETAGRLSSAVGQWLDGYYTKTFVIRFNGSFWNIAPSPNGSIYGNYLNAAAKIPGSTYAWAVGATDNADYSLHHTLIEVFHC